MTDNAHSLEPARPTCPDCGADVPSGRFCSECGTPLAQAAPAPATPRLRVVEDPAPAPAVAPASASPSSGSKAPWMLAGLLAGVVVVGGGVWYASSSKPASKSTAAAGARYAKRVADLFAPVRSANVADSRTFARLQGTNRTNAIATIEQAQSAVAQATGAIGALAVPRGSKDVQKEVREVLARETAYLNAVHAVLANPASPTVSQLTTLESNLTGSLGASDPQLVGEAGSVSGADHLVAWAPRAAATLHRQAQAKARRVRAQQQAQNGAAVPAVVTVDPYANGRACGGGVWAGPETSCAFALNVETAYFEAPGQSATVDVYSPTTGRTYVMNCAPAGSGITCSGGNGASVTF